MDLSNRCLDRRKERVIERLSESDSYYKKARRRFIDSIRQKRISPTALMRISSTIHLDLETRHLDTRGKSEEEIIEVLGSNPEARGDLRRRIETVLFLTRAPAMLVALVGVLGEGAFDRIFPEKYLRHRRA